MVIKGGSRSNGRFYAAHLGRVDTNESVRVVEARGLVADDIEGAFQEMAGVASGTRCKNFFYVASLNPRAEETLTPEQWTAATNILEAKLGLDGQPRLVVEHFKEGRTHQHVVWSRINLGTMTAISDSLTYGKHEEASRKIERDFLLSPIESVLVKDRGSPRPERRPADWESFRAETTALDPHEMKAEITALYQEADSGQAFAAALAEAGFVLARGDRRDFVLVNKFGDDHSLARRISGVKAAQLRERMSDIDREALPSVEAARERAMEASDTGGDAAATHQAEPDKSTAARQAEVEAELARQIGAAADVNPDAADLASRFGDDIATGPQDKATPPYRQEAQRGTLPDWVEAPRGTPPDWIEAPQGTPLDWVEAASSNERAKTPAPEGTPQDWQTAESGQGSDQRAEHTAWENLAGRVRSYWQRLSQFVHDQRSSAHEPQPEAEAQSDAATDAKKTWVARVMENKTLQTGLRLWHGWSHKNPAEFAEGVKDAAAIVGDILAQGPKRGEPQSAPEAEAQPGDTAPQPGDGLPPMPETTRAFDAFAASVDASKLQPRAKPVSAFDALMARQAAQQPGASPPAPEQPEPKPDSPTPEL